ncbi:MAG: FKBP-type peptidyl-prolyl cis-trans isomerase [Gammaproteobacteria bacterium]|nr:FKBP-type peptidyl-prolyl cis-trans isomerase [Gammaproteobacteria bacterium]NNM01518.1 FKBP-type peptidyl-prolyl cis-trans isomerase [Gammaproteobacteria bacterium]
MNRIFASALLIALVGSAAAQGIDTKIDDDKKMFSYAIGTQIAQSLERQGVEVDIDAFYLALRDVFAGDPPRITPEQMAAALSRGEEKAREDFRTVAADNLARGAAFLEENAKRDDVTALSNGLQYEVLRTGAGDHPSASDVVTVHYTGTLIDGREFDSSRRRGEPATFPLGNVIKGWQEAVPLMRVGDRWKIYVPPELAYGVKGAGAVIGPNSTLIFEIELLGIGNDS